MERIKGFRYRVEGYEDLTEFAKGILALINVKSCRKNTIIDIKTLEDTNITIITSITEIDEYLKCHLGEITDKEEIKIIRLEFDDLTYEKRNVIEKLWSKEKEYFVTTMNSDF